MTDHEKVTLAHTAETFSPLKREGLFDRGFAVKPEMSRSLPSIGSVRSAHLPLEHMRTRIEYDKARAPEGSKMILVRWFGKYVLLPFLALTAAFIVQGLLLGTIIL